ncbi:hypothetical protein ACHAWC_002675 [Mediolabrus comicus]
MPRLTSIEKQRSHDHLSQTRLKHTLLLSPSHPLSEIPSLSNMSSSYPPQLSRSSSSSSSNDDGNGGNGGSSTSNNSTDKSGRTTTLPHHHHQHHSWIMCDDDRIDRFSDNYYRFNWGLHKGGLVLAVFMGLILVTAGIVGAAFVYVG